MRAALRLAAALAFVFAGALTASAGYGDANVAPPSLDNVDLELGQAAVQQQDWQAALYHLEIAARAEPANATVMNLLGFTYRNLRDYPNALRYGREALRLDPDNRRAHANIGETYLLTGDKAKAREHLAALERICGQGCEEYRDLAGALARSQ